MLFKLLIVFVFYLVPRTHSLFYDFMREMLWKAKFLLGKHGPSTLIHLPHSFHLNWIPPQGSSQVRGDPEVSELALLPILFSAIQMWKHCSQLPQAPVTVYPERGPWWPVPFLTIKQNISFLHGDASSQVCGHSNMHVTTTYTIQRANDNTLKSKSVKDTRHDTIGW